MSTTILTRNVSALHQTGCPIPAAVLRTPDDVEFLHDAGQVTGVALRTPAGLVPLQTSADAIAEADSWLDAPVLAASTVAVVGGGAGHLTEALERRGFRGRVLVLEPSPGAAVAALARRDWTAPIAAGRLRWLVGPGYEGWTEAWSWLTPGEAPGIVIHPVLARARPQDVRAALDVLKRMVFNASANERARRQFAGPYLRNTLENLPHLLASQDASTLVGRLTGAPVALLAAGPSLNRNLEELAAVRDRVVAIAVDTALRPCLAAGVAPDLVVAVDPGAPNLRHLAVGRAPERTWLVAEPSVAPGSFDAFGGRCFTFRVGEHDPWPWLRSTGVDRLTLRAWGSVLTTALDLAVRSGAGPIVLLGADCAYTHGQPYCRGTVYEEEWARFQAEGKSLETIWQWWMDKATVTELGVDGTPVRTTPQLIAFRDWITEYTQASGAPILNGTGAGLLRALPSCHVDQLLADAVPLPSSAWLPVEAEARRPHVTVPPLGNPLPEPWQRWAEVSGTPVLQLVRFVADVSDDCRVNIDVGHPGDLPARPAGSVPAEAVAAWQRLHAQGYFETHPRYQDVLSDIAVDTIRRLLAPRPDDDLLEVGCGYGRLLWYLAPHVRTVTGIEIAPEPLMLARALLQRCGEVELLLGDGTTLQVVGTRRFTAVLAVTLFQFMSRAAVTMYLAEIARVLAPGGRACLQFHHDGPAHVTLDPDDPREQARFAHPRHVPVASHDEAAVRALVTAAGLRITHVERESLERYHPGEGYGWWWVLCERPATTGSEG